MGHGRARTRAAHLPAMPRGAGKVPTWVSHGQYQRAGLNALVRRAPRDNLVWAVKRGLCEQGQEIERRARQAQIRLFISRHPQSFISD